MVDFSCRQCATRFKVPDALAGKKARCKKCGASLQIPEALAAVAAVAETGLFRLGAMLPNQASQPRVPQPGFEPRSQSTSPESIRLAPISLDDLQAVAPRKKLWEEDDGVEYELEKPVETPAAMPPRILSQSRGSFWWGRGGIAETVLLALRKFSDYAYLTSIPFLLLMLLAIILKQRELAVIVAVVVILINIVRLGLSGFVLVTLAFKNGPLQGVLFFIPPFTFYYLSKRGKVLQEALRRFLGAAIPIIGVWLLAIFVPWLRAGGEADILDPSNRDRWRNELRDVRENIKTNVVTPQDSTN